MVGRQGQRDDSMPGHPKHTRLLPIRYHWRNDPLDTELPSHQPPFNETQGCSWLVQKTGLRGTLQPGERFPSLHSCFGRPRSFWEAGTIHFLQRTIFSGPSRERWRLPTLPRVARQLFYRPTADGFRWVHSGRQHVRSVLIP